MFMPKTRTPNWYPGYIHYHTSFRHTKSHRVQPNELREELLSLGCAFLFCAGDHESEYGPGWYQGEDYYEFVASLNDGAHEPFFIPTGEYHLWFPGKASADRGSAYWRYRQDHPDYMPFHHTLIPSMTWRPDIAALTREETSHNIVDKAEESNIALTLNHPGLCFISGHPDPFSVDWLERMPYYELFNEMAHFHYDFPAYMRYLDLSGSRHMGVFAGVDFLSHQDKRLSTPGNQKTRNVTYIYIEGGLTPESILDAWYQRRTYAVHGMMHLTEICPVPRKLPYKTREAPKVSFRANHFGGKKIGLVMILASGRPVYYRQHYTGSDLELQWEDTANREEETAYTIIIEAEGDWLVTSPICFSQG